jgi:hypothetical protein
MELKKEKQGIFAKIQFWVKGQQRPQLVTVDYWAAKIHFFTQSKDLKVGQIITLPDKKLKIIDIQIELKDSIDDNEAFYVSGWSGAILPSNFLVTIHVEEI